ncbi:MAG: hypothetical protein FWG73_04510 [Planctomycetaceae bacterium]|nr:hypothetical protein [Planctomycetaceae bacterium]
MPTSRFVLSISLIAFCWNANVLAQMQPIQHPQNFNPHAGQSVYQQQPVRVATAQPAAPTSTPSVGQSIPLYDPNGVNRTPVTIQPGTPIPSSPSPAVQGSMPGSVQPIPVAPANRTIPFELNPTEQRELDEFLARWERYSAGIRRYDVDFNVFKFDPTIPGAQPDQAYRIAFGHFKYIASPMRFLYAIEGEWRDNKQIKREGDRNPHIDAEKMIIDEKTVFKYDYNAKTVHQIHVPPEMIGKGIADTPLPLIFGAKADDLKRRFSLRIEHRPNDMILVYARPLLLEDQQEFKEIEIMLEKDLRARGLKQYDINDKGYKVYDLRSTKINPPMADILGHIKGWFTPDIPRGWTQEVHHWTPQPAPVAGASHQHHTSSW